MKLKNILCAAAAMCAAVSLGACGDSAAPGTVHVYMPDGAPAIALAGMMNKGYAGTQFTVVAANTIGARVTGGQADMALMPSDEAARLFLAGADIKMVTINTHGNLYFIGDGPENDELALSDLVGKRVGVIGQGKVPDLTFRMLLEKNEISYTVSNTAVPGSVAIRYGADGAALRTPLVSGDIDYALLGEPAVTTLSGALGKSVVLDIQAMWEDAFDEDFPQACLVATGKLLRERPDYVNAFVTELVSTDDWAYDNADDVIPVIKAHMESGVETTLAKLTADAVERCCIYTESAFEGRSSCDTYFGQLSALAVGDGEKALSAVPGDGFYYELRLNNK